MCAAHEDGRNEQNRRGGPGDSEAHRSFPPTVLADAEPIQLPAQTPTRPSLPQLPPVLRLDICGAGVENLQHGELVDRVQAQFHDRTRPALAVGSVNLDHIHHFGRHRNTGPELGAVLDWLMLIDGAPVARRASTVTGVVWPRLAGADLLPDMLGVAEGAGARVGFLGGQDATAPALRSALAQRWPDLQLAGIWTPPRAVLDDPGHSRRLAGEIAAAGVDLLVVGLGKPLQERWIDQYGLQTGARVQLAFGAAADFLAGAAVRAPVWMRRSGLEWLFRLLLEPRRLARRYLLEGPVSLWSLRHMSATVVHREVTVGTEALPVIRQTPSQPAPAP